MTFSCVPASGSFFSIKQVTTVTCTATDAVGNESTDTFTVEVVSPFGYIPDFVALSHQWTNIGNSVIVQTGNVGAFDASIRVPNFCGLRGRDWPLGNSARAARRWRRRACDCNPTRSAGNVYSVDPV